jgi:type IV secretory pathway TrbD component
VEVGANGVVGLQIGYAIADMTAKAGFGVLIYLIARAKSTKMASAEAYATV